MFDDEQTTKTLNALKKAVGIAATLHLVVSGDVWPEGGHLRCNECGHEVRFTREQAANFLRYGWPKCCGYTMRVV